MDASEGERMEVWLEIEKELLPSELMATLPPTEWKGLTLLVSALARSRVCKAIGGSIVADFDENVEIVVLFEEMIRERLDYLGKFGEVSGRHRSIVPPDSHLYVYARRKGEGRGWKCKACVAAAEASKLPVSDIAATFVMWADSGFARAPLSLREAIAYVKGSETYEEFVQMKRSEERENEARAEGRRLLLAAERDRLDAEARIQREKEGMVSGLAALGWRGLMAEHRRISCRGDGPEQFLLEIIERMLQDPRPI